MRSLPPEMTAALDAEAVSLCTCWIITRKDGQRLGFTDHDGAVIVQGVACEPASGWTAGAADGSLGASPGQASASGVLSSEALAESDILAGLYDGALVDTFRVCPDDPIARVRLRRETVQRLVRTAHGFTAELEGPLAALRRVVGRTYDRLCDARLGDARCRVNLGTAPAQTCDRRFATCRETFGNTLNFQGFPDIPGDDFLPVQAATAGDGGDGGSRR